MNGLTGRVLVTGANGFIGSELCRQLARQKVEFNVLIRAEDSLRNIESYPGATVFIGDIGDKAVLAEALQDVDVVFHLAGVAHVDVTDKYILQRVNVAGTATLLEAAIKQGVKRIVYFSSSLAASSTKEQAHSTPYGDSKYQAEQLLLQAGLESPLKICILRPVNVYGPGMKGNLMSLIRMIKLRRIPPLPTLDTHVSLIGVEDLCRVAIIAATAEQTQNRTYLVTDGIDYQINELETAIYSALGRQKPPWACPRLLLFAAACTAELGSKLVRRKSGIGMRTYRNLVRSNVFSSAQIVDELGFAPATTFYKELPAILLALESR